MRRYIILSLVQTLYAYFVEGDTVFVGKRKTFSKRVRIVLLPPATLLIILPDCHRTDHARLTDGARQANQAPFVRTHRILCPLDE